MIKGLKVHNSLKEAVLDKRDIMKCNNVRLKDQYEYANYQFYVWKYLGFKIVNINGRETTKDKTVCKICVNDVSYMTGNTSNMPTHLRWKHGIIWSSASFQWTRRNRLRFKDCPLSGTYYDQCQLRVSDTMFAKGPLSFNSRRAQSITKAMVGFIAKEMWPCYLK